MSPANTPDQSGERLDPGSQDSIQIETRRLAQLTDRDQRVAGGVIDLTMQDASLGPDLTRSQAIKHVIDI